MKSLYVRVVLLYLVSVIAGLLVSAIITTSLYEKKMIQWDQDNLIRVGKDMVRVYTKVMPGELEPMLEELGTLVNGRIQLYTMQGERRSFGTRLDENDDPTIDLETVQRVVGGETVRIHSKATGLTTVGIPFPTKDKKYAMFLQLSLVVFAGDFGDFIFTLLLITLGIGSLIFLVAVGFLVRPIRKMTVATQRLASGDFDVELNMRRKDELGILAQSFDKMTQEIKQMEQMRQDFVSNVSHEIQSPLTSIGGFAKALKSDRLTTEDRHTYLDIISNESGRLSKLSDNLLKLASLDSEHHPFKQENYRLDEQLRQVIVACEPQWSDKNIEIEVQLPMVQIKGDRDQLYQVWMNLLGNSIKFTPDNKKILVRIKQEIDSIIVDFIDSGIGITSEDQKYMFERFYTADRSRTRAKSGSGLGLAIVKKIVAIHHGKIEVRSEVGKGTSISVKLPSSV